MLIPCLVAFEAGFHTELKAFSISYRAKDLLHFIEQSAPVVSVHIFSS